MKRLSIASPEKTRQLMQSINLSPNKSLGQNFLVSENIVEKIEQVAQLKEGCRIIEIGSGLGALSEALAQRADCLCLIELDGRLYLHLQRLFANNGRVDIINADALSFDYRRYAADKGWRDYQVVANLPYYITSQVIHSLLLTGGPWQSLTLMTQKEVAEKLSAPNPGQGGPLAVLLHYFATVRLAFTVPPESFLPPPEIQSAVLQIERHPKPPFAVDNHAAFELFLLAAYKHRRKTLINSLQSSLGGDRPLWLAALNACNVPENYRAEQLSLQNFGALYNMPQVKKLLL